MAVVIDNRAKSRFELEEQGLIAFADYRRRDGVLYIPHVEAPEALRGTGTAGRLMEGLLGLIRSEGRKVRPICPYAVAYIARHKEYQDLLG
ncbi:MAG: GNAT family N-acetyltransferase [Caulobacterales bacterium]